MTHRKIDPFDAFIELGRIKLGETDLHGVLVRVAELAKLSLPGAHEVSVTMVRGNGAHTAASTGELALRLDEYQYEHGRGPCLQAAVDVETLSIPDIAAESRWPDWGRRAVAAGIQSSLSVGVTIEENVAGALNVYGTEPKAFDDDAIGLAQTFASYASVALANAHVYETTASLARHMQAAMESRAVIEQAKGIIMGERRCSAAAAFTILTRVSQDSNRKLRDVATALVNRAQHP
jgi:GAF domain-containing protein